MSRSHSEQTTRSQNMRSNAFTHSLCKPIVIPSVHKSPSLFDPQGNGSQAENVVCLGKNVGAICSVPWVEWGCCLLGQWWSRILLSFVALLAQNPVPMSGQPGFAITVDAGPCLGSPDVPGGGQKWKFHKFFNISSNAEDRPESLRMTHDITKRHRSQQFFIVVWPDHPMKKN